ncbi:MAG: hypothetical protein AABX32_05575 [Nanoarchaeota archaeon]
MANGIENGNEVGSDKSNVLFTDKYDIFLPINTFSNGSSGLESISQHLREAIGLKYCEIADLLNRDDRTIWGAYKSAKEKSNNANNNFSSESNIKIPLSIFKDRSLSILEALAEYLKEELNLRYCKIAVLLNKDPRTIWTAYNRAKKKIKNKENAKAS